MSQQEFENYLALLSRLLRIGPRERDRVAGEFRSHLEDRLDDLLARGVPRDEAVRQALEEFGDAAGLAAELVSLNRSRRNRWIMRLTTMSVAAVVLIAAGIVTFWPGNNAGPGRAQVVAQDPNNPNPNKPGTEKPAQVDPFAPPAGTPPAAAAPGETLADKLNVRTDADFVETPLKDAIEFLADRSGLQVIIKAKRLEEAGLAIDQAITLNLKNVRLSTLLDVMLEDLGLVYTEKDDLVVITTPDDAQATMEVRVYDCRDLLTMPTVGQARPGMIPGLPGTPAGLGVPGGSLPVNDSFAPPATVPVGGPAQSEVKVFLGLGADEVPKPGDGVLIGSVAKEGPADIAGLQAGDVIIAIDGQACKSRDQLHEYLASRNPGDRVKFTIHRESAVLTKSVTLGRIVVSFAAPGRPRSDVLPQAAGLGGVAAPGGSMGGMPGMMGGGSGMMGGGLGGGQQPPQRPLTAEELKAEQLLNIITTAVNPDSWAEMGGPGTIGEYNGLVVVSQSARTHSKIEKVLDMLREAANLPKSKDPRVVR